MRASFVFSEVVTGLRRNVTMTVAMILTTAISLGLLGGGLLVVRTIDRMQQDYYQRVETVVYLSADISANDPGCTSSTCSALRGQLESAPGVQTVIFESRQAAFARFQRIFQGQPELLQLARPEALPASLRLSPKTTICEIRFSSSRARSTTSRPRLMSLNHRRPIFRVS